MRKTVGRIEASTRTETVPGRYYDVNVQRFHTFPAALAWVRDLDPTLRAGITDVWNHQRLAYRGLDGIWRTNDGASLDVEAYA